MVFNPHPYPVTQQIEVEFQLADQNWNDNEVTLVRVRDSRGRYLPAQNEHEASNMNLDWRKRVVFTATLEPMCINRFDCELYIVNGLRRPIDPCDQTDTHYVFDNGHMQAMINKQTGLLDRYTVDGKVILTEGSASIGAFRDHEDPWKMDDQIFDQPIGGFEALSNEEANRFRGYPEAGHPNVQVIENGAVRTKIQAIFRNRNSFAVLTYCLPKQDSYIDVQLRLLVNDVNTMYKLRFHTALDAPSFFGQTAYGTEPLRTDGQENSFQKWCALRSGSDCFAVLNQCHYGGSVNDATVNISLLRTCAYSALPIEGRPTTDNDRNHDHIDMGEHDFAFRLSADGTHLDARAESYNQPAYAYSFFPSGAGAQKETKVLLSNEAILLTSLRKQGGCRLLRLYNGSSEAQTATLTMEGGSWALAFAPYEAKAFRWEDGKLTEVSLAF